MDSLELERTDYLSSLEIIRKKVTHLESILEGQLDEERQDFLRRLSLREEIVSRRIEKTALAKIPSALTYIREEGKSRLVSWTFSKIVQKIHSAILVGSSVYEYELALEYLYIPEVLRPLYIEGLRLLEDELTEATYSASLKKEISFSIASLGESIIQG